MFRKFFPRFVADHNVDFRLQAISISTDIDRSEGNINVRNVGNHGISRNFQFFFKFFQNRNINMKMAWEKAQYTFDEFG